MSEKSSIQDESLSSVGRPEAIAATNQQHDFSSTILSNAEIADRLASLVQLLSAQKENPYKIKAYQRAAAKVRTLSESLWELVQDEADLTRFAGIGEAIAAAIREVVQTGSLRKLETLRAQASPELASISQYPRLDPKRVQRIYKKLGIATADELRGKLESGEIEQVLGLRMAQHVRQGLTETPAMLLYRADDLREAVEEFLLGPCRARRVELVGEVRRRVEVIEELAFVIETDDFPAVVARLQRYGGRTPLVSSGKNNAIFAHSSGVLLRIQQAGKKDWGLQMIACTGSAAHLNKLKALTGAFRGLAEISIPTEEAFYRKFGLQVIEPELREGYDEIERAAENKLPRLVTAEDIRGELHAHSTSSDGSDSIEDMAAAARQHGYEYIGISDHSQSLKIARGVSVEDLWEQIKYIDKLNGRLRGFRILKSSEVDILADGSLDYPDDLLRELNFLVEHRSLPGFSGSPVFVWINPGLPRLPYAKVELNPHYDPMKYGPWLLGVDSCHLQNFNALLNSKDAKDMTRPLRWVKANTGMAEIVPAWKLADFLQSEEFTRQREKCGRDIDERKSV